MIALGSSSQTRAKILADRGIDFTQRECGFDEDKVRITTPCEYAYLVAKGKFEAYLKNYDFDMPFIVADTVVCVKEKILLKAKDEEDAREMLKLQSSNVVDIITCMFYKGENIEFVDLSFAKYQFAKFDETYMESYLKSGKWKGKAGACMVEGFCKNYIKSMEGLESTAMGLSIEKLLPFL